MQPGTSYPAQLGGGGIVAPGSPTRSAVSAITSCGGGGRGRPVATPFGWSETKPQGRANARGGPGESGGMAQSATATSSQFPGIIPAPAPAALSPTTVATPRVSNSRGVGVKGGAFFDDGRREDPPPAAGGNTAAGGGGGRHRRQSSRSMEQDDGEFRRAAAVILGGIQHMEADRLDERMREISAAFLDSQDLSDYADDDDDTMFDADGSIVAARKAQYCSSRAVMTYLGDGGDSGSLTGPGGYCGLAGSVPNKRVDARNDRNSSGRASQMGGGDGAAALAGMRKQQRKQEPQIAPEFLHAFGRSLQRRLDRLPTYPGPNESEADVFVREMARITKEKGLPRAQRGEGPAPVDKQDLRKISYAHSTSSLSAEAQQQQAVQPNIHKPFFPVSQQGSVAGSIPRGVRTVPNLPIVVPACSTLTQRDAFSEVPRELPVMVPALDQVREARPWVMPHGSVAEQSRRAGARVARATLSNHAAPASKGSAAIEEASKEAQAQAQARAQEALLLLEQARPKSRGRAVAHVALHGHVSLDEDARIAAIDDVLQRNSQTVGTTNLNPHETPREGVVQNNIEYFADQPTVSDDDEMTRQVMEAASNVSDYVGGMVRTVSGEFDKWREDSEGETGNGDSGCDKAARMKNIVTEIERVSRVMTATTNDDVRGSCRERLVELKAEVEGLMNEPGAFHTLTKGGEELADSLRSVGSALGEKMSEMSEAGARQISEMSEAGARQMSEMSEAGARQLDRVAEEGRKRRPSLNRALSDLSDAGAKLGGKVVEKGKQVVEEGKKRRPSLNKVSADLSGKLQDLSGKLQAVATPTGRRGKESRGNDGVIYSLGDDDEESITKQSMTRQKIILELKKTQAMMNTTTNEEVRGSCRQRIEELKLKLEDLIAEHGPTSLAPEDADAPELIESIKSVGSMLTEIAGEKVREMGSTVGDTFHSVGDTVHEMADTNAKLGGMFLDDVAESHAQLHNMFSSSVNQLVDGGGVQVKAPANLPPGYKFQAQIGRDHFTATVPPDGVTEGQVFTSTAEAGVGAEEIYSGEARVIEPKAGMWKDGVCDCMKYGVHHPMFLNGIFCPQIALGQVMTRLNLTWLGTPGPSFQVRDTFKIALSFTVFLVLLNGILVGTAILNYHRFLEWPILNLLLACMLNCSFFIYFILLVARTRRFLRRRFAVPEAACRGSEDLLVSAALPACTIMQMGRHTAKYDTYHASCCSDNGFPQHIHVVLPPTPSSAGRTTLDEPLNPEVVQIV